MTRLLLAASETPDEQAARRSHTGQASHESYADTLRGIDPELVIETISCVDGAPTPGIGTLQTFDGVVFPGSPIQMHEKTEETRRAAAFMAGVFASGTPGFGSCAGLQIAAVAAGGTSRPRDGEMEAAFARGISRTDAGRDHPLLKERPNVWDAPAMHSAIIDRMPEGGRILAEATGTPVEAAEIHHGAGTFWGVQYHPELTLVEIADALRRQSDALIENGLARGPAMIEEHARALAALGADPERRDIAWRIGVDTEVTDPARRTREIRNFLSFLRDL